MGKSTFTSPTAVWERRTRWPSARQGSVPWDVHRQGMEVAVGRVTGKPHSDPPVGHPWGLGLPWGDGTLRGLLFQYGR